ncbi:hypothetical protein [Streptomyces sp. NBC_01803]|uniref:hypothetical protein n=1 Tax=Streptomyces sp. NBC_01803 TaxID=2975946 RepID=UPI002DDA5CF9|nr:hypothetical protein [Streptomyces sp. NBC_01803]WSA47801.1 hypothetical protein OIE51_19975 [Streptomyces sp. NBC_01803]
MPHRNAPLTETGRLRLARCVVDVVRTARDLADIAVPDLADFVAVDLLEPVLRGGEPASPAGSGAGTVPLSRAGQQSVREDIPEAVVRIGERADHHAGRPPRAPPSAGRRGARNGWTRSPTSGRPPSPAAGRPGPAGSAGTGSGSAP